MEKKMMTILILLCLTTIVFSADSINNYTVKQNVFLNQPVTAFGVFQSDVNKNGNVLCSFYLIDANTRALIDQADDDYTDARGNFAMSFSITEPNFDRDTNIGVQVVCGRATETQYFVVGNFETIADSTSKNFGFITDKENVDTLFIIGGFFFVLFIISLFILGLMKFKGSI